MNYDLDLEQEDLEILKRSNFEKDHYGHIGVLFFMFFAEAHLDKYDLEKNCNQFKNCSTVKEVAEKLLNEYSGFKVKINIENPDKIIEICECLIPATIMESNSVVEQLEFLDGNGISAQFIKDNSKTMSNNNSNNFDVIINYSGKVFV